MALVPAAVIAILFAVLPVFSEVSGVSWFIGAALGGLFYLPLAKRRVADLRDVSGEPIAVPSVH